MEELITLDQRLLLALNGSESTALDAFFMTVTRTAPWVPLFVIVIAVLWRRVGWRETLLIVAGTALVVLLSDRISSGICKPLFHRFRPSHEPALAGLVDIVGDYRGGLYGFFSSHAANTFGVASFVTLCTRRSGTGIVCLLLFLWAVLSSYSRIYLGLHYPGDIAAGILCGTLMAFVVYRCFYVPLYPRITNKTL